MCVHCEWLKSAELIGATTIDKATAVLMNSPRHTPQTRAGFAAGAVCVVALQGMFQALRKENPAALDELLTVVLEWARRHLDKWPFGCVDSTTGQPVDDPHGAFPGLAPPPGRPGGGEKRSVAASAYAERVSGVSFPSLFREYVRRWKESRFTDGTWPTGTKTDDGKTFADDGGQITAVPPGDPRTSAAAELLKQFFGPGYDVDVLDLTKTQPVGWTTRQKPSAAAPQPPESEPPQPGTDTGKDRRCVHGYRWGSDECGWCDGYNRKLTKEQRKAKKRRNRGG